MQTYSSKKIYALFMAVVAWFCAMGITVHGAGLPSLELDRTGSISIKMQDARTQAAVSGGTITLYRVADIKKEKDADYSFALTDEFTGSGESLTSLDVKLADRLADYVEEERMTGERKTVGASGKASFEDLEPGLFLLIQKQAAKGYYEVKPFLVSVPTEEDGRYVYDVDAVPKMEEVLKEPVTETPETKKPPGQTANTPTSTPGKTSTAGSSPKTGDFSQTGVWLALAAASLCGTGGILLSRRLKRNKR